MKYLVGVFVVMVISVNANAGENYKPVSPKEIVCALKNFHYEGLMSKPGAKPFSSKIGELHCGLGFGKGSKKIELAPHSRNLDVSSIHRWKY